MSSGAPQHGPLEIARRVVAREIDPQGNGKPAIAAAALERACRRVTDVLYDSMGEDGCNALLARACARAVPAHPALQDIRPLNGGGLRLDGIVALMTNRSTGEVTSAVEAMLAALVDVLGRLIGDDMAMRLIDHDAEQRQSGNGAPTA
jgi:hypothetical protein